MHAVLQNVDVSMLSVTQLDMRVIGAMAGKGDGAVSKAGSAVGLLSCPGVGGWMIGLLIDFTATTALAARDLDARHDISIVFYGAAVAVRFIYYPDGLRISSLPWPRRLWQGSCVQVDGMAHDMHGRWLLDIGGGGACAG
jgi:hypothetical protein